MNKINLIKLTILSIFIAGCQTIKKSSPQSYKDFGERETFRIVFYNTENFFDTENDSSINDDEFTPEGKKHWTYSRYMTKAQNISKVLIASGEWKMPELIGLAEIENRKVLEDLIRKTPLSSDNYEIIHKESPDPRGIDVALLYCKTSFKPVYYKFVPVKYLNEMPTRDILYAKGIIIKTGDTIHIFVNHWPSRIGGKDNTEAKRKFVASLLKYQTDSILKLNPASNIIITGDLNDEPEDSSIFQVLDANNDTIFNPTEKSLFNLMYRLKKNDGGTIKYKYEWSLFDQFIISKSFFNKNNKVYTTTQDAHIFRPDFILLPDDKFGGTKPFETYNGLIYTGGYSDHLPVYLDLRFR